MTLIDVYADIACPFAHAGLRSVARRRHELGRDDVIMRVRAWPLELVNGRPHDPVATGEHVADIRQQVASDLFAGFDQARFPTTTLSALALESAAYRRSADVGEAVSLALREALFEEGRDVSQPDVLHAVAEEFGVGAVTNEDDGQIRSDWSDGQARGVQGSPHFFCGELEGFCPSLDISKDEGGHLHLRRDTAALDEFLAECFKL
ncbi:MAG: hypothetical protein NVS3B12_28740 [Acidimicrobiales bacterium]